MRLKNILLFIFLILTATVQGQELFMNLANEDGQTILMELTLNWTGQLGPFDIEIQYDTGRLNFTGNCTLPLKDEGYNYVFECIEPIKGVIRVGGYYNGLKAQLKNEWKLAYLEFEVLNKTEINSAIKGRILELESFGGSVSSDVIRETVTPSPKMQNEGHTPSPVTPTATPSVPSESVESRSEIKNTPTATSPTKIEPNESVEPTKIDVNPNVTVSPQNSETSTIKKDIPLPELGYGDFAFLTLVFFLITCMVRFIKQKQR